MDASVDLRKMYRTTAGYKAHIVTIGDSEPYSVRGSVEIRGKHYGARWTKQGKFLNLATRYKKYVSPRDLVEVKSLAEWADL